MNTNTKIAALAIAGAVLASCSLLTGLNDHQVGIIEWIEDSSAYAGSATLMYADPDGPIEEPVLEAPDTVQAGQTFEIVVRTYARNGCWRELGAEIERDGLRLEVTPYDEDYSAGNLCTQAGGRLPRTLDVSFPEPGEGRIQVTGWKVMVGDSLIDAGLTTIEELVVVQ